MEVIGKPVVVVGNSIGGFVGTSMAADNPSIVSHDWKNAEPAGLSAAVLIMLCSKSSEVCAPIPLPVPWSPSTAQAIPDLLPQMAPGGPRSICNSHLKLALGRTVPCV